MPNIVDDVKLDFKDVLLRPKRSKIRSRADVSTPPTDRVNVMNPNYVYKRLSIILITSLKECSSPVHKASFDTFGAEID